MSALRSFASYTNVAPVSPKTWVDNQKTKTRELAFPCNLVNMDGTTAAATGYFQIFDLAVAPTTNVTVPLKSLAILQAGPLATLLCSLGPIMLLQGLYCAISSTEAVYTAQNSNFDVWGEVEEWEGQLLDTISVAGDLTTGRDELDVWADNQAVPAPQKLLQVDVINGTGAAAYLMLFSYGILGTVPPMMSWPLPTTTTQKTFFFGQFGIEVMSSDANPNVIRRGCIVAVSTTPGVYTTPGTPGLNKIRAYYKASLT